MKNNRKTPDSDYLKMLGEIAEMYHKQDRTEKEIAAHFGWKHPMKVSRMLKQAREHNIVEVKINTQHIDKLREKLMDTFSLTEVRLAPYSTNYPSMRSLVAKEAAKYLDNIIETQNTHRGMSIGISGGKTIHEMIESLDARPRKIKIYPLVGIWRDPKIHYVDSAVLTHLLWYKSQDAAEAFWFPLEPIKEGTAKRQVKAQREKYLRNPLIKSVYEAAIKVDVAFFGVGVLKRDSATIMHLEKIGITYDELHDKGAVGSVGGIWFNSQALPVIDDYFLSIPLNTLRPHARQPNKKAVIVATGENKLDAIKVLLKNKIGNVLITDNKTALQLLQ